MKYFRLFVSLFVSLFLCLFVSSFSFAQDNKTVSLKFDSISIVGFATATYKSMLQRDFVVSPDLLAFDKPITINVKNIAFTALPKFVENVFASQGISSIEKDGIYYLSLEQNRSTYSSPVPLSFPPSNISQQNQKNQNEFIEVKKIDSVDPFDFEQHVFNPTNRKVDFIATVINSVFLTKPATVAGGVLVFSASKEMMPKITELAQSIDLIPPKVKISASFVEVSNIDSSNFGISIIADLLGAKLGVTLGNSSNNSLTLGNSSFQLVIDAIASDSRFKQVSNPSFVVDSNEKGNVNFGDSVPTISGSSIDKNGNVVQQVVYQNSGVLFDVLPRVLGSGDINLQIDGQVSSFSQTTTGVNSSPTLSKRQVQTSLTLKNNEILLIGGLNSNKKSVGKSGFLFLPDSFSAESTSSSNTDLVLILTATVLQ
jgi:general secretion pathway protein D